jgi:hypothetical protein
MNLREAEPARDEGSSAPKITRPKKQPSHKNLREPEPAEDGEITAPKATTATQPKKHPSRPNLHDPEATERNGTTRQIDEKQNSLGLAGAIRSTNSECQFSSYAAVDQQEHNHKPRAAKVSPSE